MMVGSTYSCFAEPGWRTLRRAPPIDCTKIIAMVPLPMSQRRPDLFAPVGPAVSPSVITITTASKIFSSLTMVRNEGRLIFVGGCFGDRWFLRLSVKQRPIDGDGIRFRL